MSNLLVQNIKHTNNTTAQTIDTSGRTTVSIMNNDSTFRSDGGAVTQNLVQGIAKVWAKCDEHTIEDSFNVTSSTDEGTGLYTITIANDMQRVEYSLTISSLADQTGIKAMATGSYRRECSNSSGTAVDVNFVNSTVHGDLA